MHAWAMAVQGLQAQGCYWYLDTRQEELAQMGELRSAVVWRGVVWCACVHCIEPVPYLPTCMLQLCLMRRPLVSRQLCTMRHVWGGGGVPRRR